MKLILLNLFISIVCLSEAAIVMEIELQDFDTRGKDINGNCCDPLCGDCDPKFEMCIGGEVGRGFCMHKEIITGFYQGQNLVVFGREVGDSTNPFTFEIEDPFTPVRFTMIVIDDDGPDGDDVIDTFDFDLYPGIVYDNRSEAIWTEITELGQRESSPSIFNLRHKAYREFF